MKLTSLFGLVSMLALLAACSSTQRAAPVLERNANGQVVEVPHAQDVVRSPLRKADEHGYYTVKKGDTLQHIALDNGQNYHDLVIWNGLANPNDIKVDQVLRVLPPDEGNSNVQVLGVPDYSSHVTQPAPVGATAPKAAGIVPNISAPHGEKRPYSDVALAEMQKPDVAAPTSATNTVATTTGTGAAVAVAPTAADKAADIGASDEPVSWMWPVDGKPSAAYEDAKKGIDIAGKSGQQVLAAASGKVLYAGTMRGYGNMIVVKHNGTLWSVYAHNKTILVKEGQVVSKGQAIAEMGDTDTDSVKLHFEIRQQGKPVDPTKFLPAR